MKWQEGRYFIPMQIHNWLYLRFSISNLGLCVYGENAVGSSDISVVFVLAFSLGLREVEDWCCGGWICHLCLADAAICSESFNQAICVHVRVCVCAHKHTHTQNGIDVFLIGAAAEIPWGLKLNVYVQSIGWLFTWHIKCTGTRGVLGCEKVEGLLKLGHQFVKNTKTETTKNNK